MTLTNKNSQFKFVRLPLRFNNGSECDVMLLIDEDAFIHDYRVKWNKLYITQYTTASHFEHPESLRFVFRDKLIKALGYKHKKNIGFKKHKAYIGPLSKEQIEIANKMFFNEWIGQTFANIAYVITGSNTGGEGDPKQAEYKTPFGKNNEYYAIGMFLQSMRFKIDNEILKSNEYLQFWDKNIFEQETKTFKTWVKTIPQLESEILWFNSDKHSPDEWKLHMLSLKTQSSLRKIKYESLLKKIMSFRNELSNLLVSKTTAFKNFWGYLPPHEPGFEIQYAHIKPVWLIKKEYLATDDEKILDQIKDVNNIIPLDSDTHKKFDSLKLYWDLEGQMFVSHDLDKSLLRTYAKRLPESKIQLIKPFIQEYINKVLSNKRKNFIKFN